MANQDVESTRRIVSNNGYVAPSHESVAYDYSRFDTRERLAPPPPELTVVNPRPARRARERAGLNPNLVLLALIIGALAVSVVMSSVSLSEKTYEASGLKDELSTLSSEATVLETRQDERFSLAAVEAYAVDELGMIKLSNEQLRYVDISNPDKVEVIGTAENPDKPLYLAILEKLKVNKS